MIAPPRPPSHDELEALIKEARARQLRRRLLGAAAVAIATALALGVYAVVDGAKTTATAGGGGPRAIVACGAAAGWSLSLGPLGSEPTGQHTAPLVVTRTGSNACTLSGYPTVVLQGAHGRTLDFRYSHHGDLVVSARPPRAVYVGAGGSAFFLVNKYRCDVRAAALARRILVRLPGVRGWLSIRLPHYPMIDYCPVEGASTSIAVSPVVANLRQAAAQLQ
jgi:hypothetical protein